MKELTAKFKELLSTKLDGFEMFHGFSVALDKTKEAKANAKAIFVTYVCNGLNVGAIFDEALRPLDIKVAGMIRKDYDSYKDGQKLTIVIADMGKRGPAIAPEAAVRNKFTAAATVEARAAILHETTGIELAECIAMVEAHNEQLDAAKAD